MNGETQTAVDIQNIINVFPVWEEDVWGPLQKKQFPEAQRNLERLLKSFDTGEWEKIYWAGLIKGVPAVRGALNQNDWSSKVKPILVKSLLGAATGKIISNIYQNLSLEEQIELTGLIFANLPGENRKEKAGFLKKNKASVFVFFTAALAQDLGINPSNQPDATIAKRAVTKYGSLPRLLQNTVFSFDAAEKVFRVGQNNHLSEEKISALAKICGEAVMGLIHPEDLSNKIQLLLLTDKRLSDELSREIKTKLLVGIENEIKSAYEPITDIIEREEEPEEKESEKIISLESIGGEAPEEKKIEIKKEPSIAEVVTRAKAGEPQPLILHKEESLTEEKRPGIKGFSLPFGFFRKDDEEKGRREIPQVKVKIETPGEPPEEASGGEKNLLGFPKKEEERVVHYSEFRTPLSPFGKAEEFIKIPVEDLAPVQKAEVPEEKEVGVGGAEAPLKPSEPESEPKIMPSPAPGEPKRRFLISNVEDGNAKNRPEATKGPSVEGNTVDLRQTTNDL